MADKASKQMIENQYGNRPDTDPVTGERKRDPQHEWVTAFDPMSEAQKAILKRLSNEARQPDAFSEHLTKAEADKRIAVLNQVIRQG